MNNDNDNNNNSSDNDNNTMNNNNDHNNDDNNEDRLQDGPLARQPARRQGGLVEVISHLPNDSLTHLSDTV